MFDKKNVPRCEPLNSGDNPPSKRIGSATLLWGFQNDEPAFNVFNQINFGFVIVVVMLKSTFKHAEVTLNVSNQNKSNHRRFHTWMKSPDAKPSGCTKHWPCSFVNYNNYVIDYHNQLSL